MRATGIFFLSFIFFTSCNFFDDSNVLPPSSGKAGELIVLIENSLWETDIQDSLKKYLAYELEGLPRAESAFRIINIPQKAFNQIFKTHRNILTVRIGPSLGVKKAEKLSDSQLFIRLEAPDVPGLRKLLHMEGERLAKLFMQEEIEREQRRVKKALLEGFHQQTRSEQGFLLDVPRDFTLTKTATKNTYHLQKEVHKSTLGLLIFVTPYTDEGQFELEGLIADRNLMCKPNILGERSGSYMKTEERLPVSLKPVPGIGSHGVVARGLWKMKHDFMGGPFIQYRILSPDKSKIVTIDGYVYGPGSKKRNHLLELEAIMSSIRF